MDLWSGNLLLILNCSEATKAAQRIQNGKTRPFDVFLVSESAQASNDAHVNVAQNVIVAQNDNVAQNVNVIQNVKKTPNVEQAKTHTDTMEIGTVVYVTKFSDKYSNCAVQSQLQCFGNIVSVDGSGKNVTVCFEKAW